MKEYDAYLFDADGTLMDTREMICQSFAHMGRELGIDMPPRAYVESTIGLPVDAQVELLVGTGHPEVFYERGRQLYRDHLFEIYLEYLRLFPGTKEMLDELARRGKKLAVVTSRRRHGLEQFFTELGIWDMFPVTVTPEDAAKAKPDPEPALLACTLLGVPPERSVFVGDAEFDIVCGHAAGMDTVLVEWGGMDTRGWPVQPTFVARTMSDLLPEG